MWRSIEQCHVDVMGRFDREQGQHLGRYHGMQWDGQENSQLKTLVLGRCTVPSDRSLVVTTVDARQLNSAISPLVEDPWHRCLAAEVDTCKEVVELLASELSLDPRSRDETSVLTALTEPRQGGGATLEGHGWHRDGWWMLGGWLVG
eukprot:Skav212577  [mRNA]  locus=scaffold125:326812:330501:- [translate_table: standard]